MTTAQRAKMFALSLKHGQSKDLLKKEKERIRRERRKEMRVQAIELGLAMDTILDSMEKMLLEDEAALQAAKTLSRTSAAKGQQRKAKYGKGANPRQQSDGCWFHGVR